MRREIRKQTLTITVEYRMLSTCQTRALSVSFCSSTSICWVGTLRFREKKKLKTNMEKAKGEAPATQFCVWKDSMGYHILAHHPMGPLHILLFLLHSQPGFSAVHWLFPSNFTEFTFAPNTSASLHCTNPPRFLPQALCGESILCSPLYS